jgi:hypothetical protein
MAAARSEGVLPFSCRKCVAAMSGLAVSSLSPYFSRACGRNFRIYIPMTPVQGGLKCIAVMSGLAVSSLSPYFSRACGGGNPCLQTGLTPVQGGRKCLATMSGLAVGSLSPTSCGAAAGGSGLS